eukprot:Blabericola_migrator_1__3013@NODE_1876_length_3615_cov_430_362740_g1201_i0_p2_GENE_NODE_1876_length_3615_cov_430_362740_g1201_i0NODE_1876_length_3615_cov_430_362740_g1201_i0_p2_ORF_typecomplete_len183_score16_82_NODE_1876_length_3615_cov_430_362740_g1201_i075551
MNYSYYYPSNDSRQSSFASMGVPMSVQRQDHTGTIYLDKGETSTVQVHSLPPIQVVNDMMQQLPSGSYVQCRETRQALPPSVVGPQTVKSKVSTSDMQPTYSVKTYDTIRRDPYAFAATPGARIVKVGQPSPVQTPIGAVYDPVTNTVSPPPALKRYM